nr:phosphoribosyltransferase family protein [Nakamurella flavida]
MIRIALRRNPRRAQLLVSTVLGKHIPADPAVITAAGHALGDRVRDALGGERPRLVLGFAETATSLGHLVHDAVGADLYLHSTRRTVPGVPVTAEFSENHSHATGHLLTPWPVDPLTAPEEPSERRPVVLVDDELSTGATARAVIAELHRLRPASRYVLAGLVDLRGPADERTLQDLARRLGCPIDVVSLARGEVELPDDVIAQVAARLPDPADSLAAAAVTVTRLDLPWPAGLPQGGRHGFAHADRPAFDDAVRGAAERLGAELGDLRPGPLLVLGSEELMYLPLRLAAELAAVRPERAVLFQSTTRSPVHALDVDGYPVRRRVVLPAFDPADDVPRYVYNLADPDRPVPPAAVVLVLDTTDAADAAVVERVAAALTAATGAPVLTAVLAQESR